MLFCSCWRSNEHIIAVALARFTVYLLVYESIQMKAYVVIVPTSECLAYPINYGNAFFGNAYFTGLIEMFDKAAKQRT